jgi:hypothetical protein
MIAMLLLLPLPKHNYRTSINNPESDPRVSSNSSRSSSSSSHCRMPNQRFDEKSGWTHKERPLNKHNSVRPNKGGKIWINLNLKRRLVSQRHDFCMKLVLLLRTAVAIELKSK